MNNIKEINEKTKKYLKNGKNTIVISVKDKKILNLFFLIENSCSESKYKLDNLFFYKQQNQSWYPTLFGIL